MKFRKTALIEAEQFDAVQWEKGLYHAIEEFDYAPSKREKARRKYCRETGLYNDTVHGGYRLKTLEGPMRLRNGDWIATGVNGEHWAIADDVFKKTYEAVKDGCNYCQQDKALMQTESGALIIINNKLFEIVAWDDYNDRPSDKVNDLEINYCPMCGRKLGADEV